MSLLSVVERREVPDGTVETIALLGDYVSSADHKSIIGASFSRSGLWMSPGAFLSQDVLREAGGIDVSQAGHLIDHLKVPEVISPEHDTLSGVFKPRDLAPKAPCSSARTSKPRGTAATPPGTSSAPSTIPGFRSGSPPCSGEPVSFLQNISRKRGSCSGAETP